MRALAYQAALKVRKLWSSLDESGFPKRAWGLLLLPEIEKIYRELHREDELLNQELERTGSAAAMKFDP